MLGREGEGLPCSLERAGTGAEETSAPPGISGCPRGTSGCPHGTSGSHWHGDRRWGQTDTPGRGTECSASSLAFHSYPRNVCGDHSVNTPFVTSSADFIPNIYPNGRN